ncbi:MAG: S46 family peptidase [Xanthomonadales bacterium]|nr:S46 family peptidase [Gammaproteobacteria bacterium]NND58218.1 S46 family peptidase [Xanthomonadales bacterium]
MKPELLLLLAAVNLSAFAAEGMWTPAQLPGLTPQLEAKGLQIDPRSMTDLTAHPMKAIVSLGGCTASFVSPKGLVITNHHCAYSSISYNSTEERNLLRDGFASGNFADELPARPGSRVLVTVAVDDVSNTILRDIPAGMSGRARYQAIEDSEKELVRECEKDPGHRCRVASYHGGLQYELIKQLEIRDVRLVFAPPASVGNYGGDIDNWMWPRHTGDYSFYRAYVGPDGLPADPGPDNVPFEPEHWLKVQPAGVQDGDYVMVAGYPGRTNRYRLSSEVGNVIGWTYPEYKLSREAWLAAVMDAIEGKPDAALKYASLVSGLNNATKNYGGMLEGFAKGSLVEHKLQLERELREWTENQPQQQDSKPSALEALNELVEESISRQQRELYYGQANRSALLGAARTLYRLAREQQKPDEKREPGYQQRDLLRIRERLTRIERTFDAQVERPVWRHLVLAYAAIPPDQHVAAFDRWFSIDGNAVDTEALDEQLEEMYAGTTLSDTRERLSWIGKTPQEFESSTDPFIRLAVALYDSDIQMEEITKDLSGRYQEARPRFMQSLLAFQQARGQSVYPDANGTLRISYGVVIGSTPRDGMAYLPFTTVEGITEKNTGNEPFDAPPGLLESIAEKRFGPYVDKQLGSVPVNFLSTLDTTGGNSGSPTLNGRAELVGLLFDGTFESIISDWDFLPDKTRSIQVDIRYVLWSMEQLGGAEHLLREMGLGG